MSAKDSTAKSSWLKPSYRTLPEQAVGLSIFLIISFALTLFTHWMMSFSLTSSWFQGLIQAPWVLARWPEGPFWIGYHFLVPLSIWLVWRRFSFYTLKLELSVFLFQLLIEACWSFSFFYLQETFLALICLLFLCCNTLVSLLLFRKKEEGAPILLLPSFLWVFYVMGINMAICMSNP